MGKPEFINQGVIFVATLTIKGLCITVNKNFAFFKSAVDL